MVAECEIEKCENQNPQLVDLKQSVLEFPLGKRVLYLPE